jgi:hypothetical protein
VAVVGSARPTRLDQLKTASLFFSGLMLGVVVFGCGLILWEARGGPPAPAPAYDPALVPVGRAYRAVMPSDYADAWDKGAAALDAGDAPDKALAAVVSAWGASREDHFHKTVNPEFSKIAPDGQDLHPEARANLARAWRGFARGLRGQR